MLHSTVANGRVLSIDKTEAERVPGLVKILTCFDLTEKHYFPTAGHPWSTDPAHQDVADRLMLTDRVRFWGNDIAAVVAEDEVAAVKGKPLNMMTIDAFARAVLSDIHPPGQLAGQQGLPRAHRGGVGEARPGQIHRTGGRCDRWLSSTR